MSEKVEPFKPTLPKEVANGIKHIESTHKLGFVYDLEGIRSSFQGGGEPYGAVVRWATASRENMILYFHALVNGYEVEQTPEDKVREMYERLDFSYEPEIAIGKAIVRTIDLLNIKIDGVNS